MSNFFCLLFVVLVGFFVCPNVSAYCHGKPDPNALPNNLGYFETNPIFISSTDNGKLYMVGPEEQQIYLLHLYGNPYQMGYAQGTLLKDVVTSFITEVWEYILSGIPYHSLIPELENKTLEEALQLTADATAPFTPDYFYDEIRGLSDSTGIDYDDILRIHMLPSLTQGHCSMFGAWGNATKLSLNSSLIQLRALDWDTDGPFKDYPALIVYHPSNGHSFANLAFTGFIGSITGVSSSRCSISEIGVSYPDDSFGKESRFGQPFPFMLRDILQFDNSVNDATQRMTNVRRTCDLILGVGCGQDDNQNELFRGYEYSYSTLNVYNWDNMEPYNQTWHPRIGDIVYYGMDWLCPNYDTVLSQQLLKYYGNIDTNNSITNIVAQTQTGNLHIAIYNYFEDAVYFSFHSRSDQINIQQTNAYDRPYLKFNLKDLFEES